MKAQSIFTLLSAKENLLPSSEATGTEQWKWGSTKHLILPIFCYIFSVYVCTNILGLVKYDFVINQFSTLIFNMTFSKIVACTMLQFLRLSHRDLDLYGDHFRLIAKKKKKEQKEGLIILILIININNSI